MTVSVSTRRRVAQTALELPVFGFGAAHLGELYARVDEAMSRATLEAAWQKGVRFYDKAMSEQLIGTPGKPGDIKGLIRLANETWSGLQGKRLEVSYDDLVDPRFVSE